MKRIQYLILGMILLLTVACGDMNQENAATDETGNATGTQKKTGQEAPPAASQPRYATLSAGTVIPVRLQDPLDTAVNKTGDTFRAVVDEDLLSGNRVVVPRGSVV